MMQAQELRSAAAANGERGHPQTQSTPATDWILLGDFPEVIAMRFKSNADEIEIAMSPRERSEIGASKLTGMPIT